MPTDEPEVFVSLAGTLAKGTHMQSVLARAARIVFDAREQCKVGSVRRASLCQLADDLNEMYLQARYEPGQHTLA